MKTFTLMVYPNLDHNGLKMSRSVEVQAENRFIAQEQVQGMYPNARVVVIKEETSSNLEHRSDASSGEAFAYLGVFIGHVIRRLLRNN